MKLVSFLTRHVKHVYSCSVRNFSKDVSEKVGKRTNTTVTRNLGQPSFYTHPFVMEEGEVTPGFTKQDYENNRIRLMKSVVSHNKNNEGDNFLQHVVILFGATTMYMTEDIPYPFHQNNNFRYLTGFLEPDSCLILESKAKEHVSTLLVPKRDVHKELWHGSRAGTDGALDLTGVDQTDEIDNLPNLLKKYLSPDIAIWYDYQKMTNIPRHMNIMKPFLSEAIKQKCVVRPVNQLVQVQRNIKLNNELLLMAKAAKVTCEAFKKVMEFSHSNVNESSIQALLDCESRLRGAQMLAYPPVVAGGNRANTLHYISNNQQVKYGELVLVDGGAEYHGYVADVTRTWPINGRFTSAQRTIYDIVLKVQKACIEACKVGSTLDEIYSLMSLLIAQELNSNNILMNKVKTNEVNIQEVKKLSRKYCPHHIGHWLGMDVHDTSEVHRSIQLQHGMVVTMEPGIYIKQDDNEVHEKYKGIGIRIEDDVIITKQGPIVITDACPKDPDEIETLMASANS